jgi:phosphoribosyl 1,2-cyclic phosphodiesterase
LKFCVLGSGSEGNSIILANNSSAIMIDAGFSLRQISERMEFCGFDISSVSGLNVTHEHSDHIRGAGVIARKRQIPLFATEQTLLMGKPLYGNLSDARVISRMQSFKINGFEIHPFSISHDAGDPIGMVIESEGFRIGICTDLGYVTHLVRQKLMNCHAILIEMNHDIQMLLAGSYPWPLKQRIRSNRGHLSNEDGGELIRDVWHHNLQHVVIGHLSKENNIPDLARLTAQQAIQSMGGAEITKLHVADQAIPSGFLDFKTPSTPDHLSPGGVS